MATTTTPMPTTTDTTTPAPTTTLAAVVQPLATPVVSPLAAPTGARKGTHFHGPVCSGRLGLEVIGQALLVTRFDIDKSTGNFGGTAPGVPLVFPPGAMLLRTIVKTTVAFDGTTPKVNLGTTPGASDIISLSIGAVTATEAPSAPALMAALPTNNTIYASVTGGPFTTGHASVAIEYLGAPNTPWS